MKRLDNSGWGFESNCFVCEERNDRGLRIRFFHDEDGGRVQASFALDRSFSGAPQYVHGGVVLAIVDEAIAWAAIALAGRFAVTRALNATFERPVRVGRTYTVEATVVALGDDIATEACVLDDTGRLCVRAEARLVALTTAGAEAVIGATVAGADRDLLAEG